MTDSQIDQFVAAIRALPPSERLRVAKRVLEGLSPDERDRIIEQVQAPAGTAAGTPAMLGLFANEPEVVDEVCRHAYAERAVAQVRSIDD